MRRALFWSLAAHVFVLWLVVEEHASEADMVGSGLAVTIATRPTTPRVATAAPASTLLPVMPKLLVGNDATAPEIHQPTVTKNVDAPALMVATASPPAPVLSVVPSISSTTALDADGLRRYRFALAHEIRRAWAYPPQALPQKLEGTTEIRIELLADGRFVAGRIEKSSGHQVLDEAALKIISNAAAAAPVPRSLLGQAISIVQPVVFSVRSENHLPEN